ncbi:hypothetical protein MHK_004958, partial [Candidatus Magnetomorum sp. HK-1]
FWMDEILVPHKQGGYYPDIKYQMYKNIVKINASPEQMEARSLTTSEGYLFSKALYKRTMDYQGTRLENNESKNAFLWAAKNANYLTSIYTLFPNYDRTTLSHIPEKARYGTTVSNDFITKDTITPFELERGRKRSKDINIRKNNTVWKYGYSDELNNIN